MRLEHSSVGEDLNVHWSHGRSTYVQGEINERLKAGWQLHTYSAAAYSYYNYRSGEEVINLVHNFIWQKD